MFSETIELRGHIIDSLILPKVLDQILTHGANFKIGEIKIGKKRADQSFARIEVSAETTEALDELVLRLRQHGAEVAKRADAQLAQAPADGVFPREFYVTTNQQSFGQALASTWCALSSCDMSIVSSPEIHLQFTTWNGRSSAPP